MCFTYFYRREMSVCERWEEKRKKKTGNRICSDSDVTYRQGISMCTTLAASRSTSLRHCNRKWLLRCCVDDSSDTDDIPLARLPGLLVHYRLLSVPAPIPKVVPWSWDLDLLSGAHFSRVCTPRPSTYTCVALCTRLLSLRFAIHPPDSEPIRCYRIFGLPL